MAEHHKKIICTTCNAHSLIGKCVGLRSITLVHGRPHAISWASTGLTALTSTFAPRRIIPVFSIKIILNHMQTKFRINFENCSKLFFFFFLIDRINSQVLTRIQNNKIVHTTKKNSHCTNLVDCHDFLVFQKFAFDLRWLWAHT